MSQISNVIELEKYERIKRDADAIACKCGGYVDRVEVTKAEDDKFGCPRRMGCCSRAFVCRVCKKRIVGKAQVPEAD